MTPILIWARSSEQAQNDVLDALEKAQQDGATLVTGGEKMNRPGWFVRPALLTDVDIDSETGCEEIFGPVMIVFKAKDEEEALYLANHTEYGLMASVWTGDLDKGRCFAEQIEAGMTFVNSHMESAPEFPFGGINRSGFRSENAQWGLREFTNEHLVRVHDAKF